MPGGGGGRVEAWVGTVNADTPSMDNRNSFARFGSHPSTSVGTPPGPEPSPCPGAEPSPCPGAITSLGQQTSVGKEVESYKEKESEQKPVQE